MKQFSENCCILGIRHAVSSKVQGTVKVRKFKKVWNLNSTQILICNPGDHDVHDAVKRTEHAYKYVRLVLAFDVRLQIAESGRAGGRDAELLLAKRGSPLAKCRWLGGTGTDSGCVPDASRCVGMRRDASGCVGILNSSKIRRSLANSGRMWAESSKIWQKLAKNSK